MILLSRLNGKSFILNEELIEYMESTPDTIITLTNGKKYVVSDGIDEVIAKIVEYRKQLYTLVLADSSKQDQ